MNIIPDHPDPDKKKIVYVYVAFAICVIFSVIPHVAAAFLSLVFLSYAMVLAYYGRSKRHEDSLMANHMTFIIRTIWLTGFYSIFTMAAAVYYLLERIDNTPLNPCIDKFLHMGPENVTAGSIDDLNRLFMSCMEPFVNTNFQTFFISLLIGGGPILLYLIVRFARGFSRALHGYRIAHPAAWL